MKIWKCYWWMPLATTIRQHMRPLMKQRRRKFGHVTVAAMDRAGAKSLAEGTAIGRANAGRIISVSRA